MTSFTASGARRTGDEYQDLQSAEVLIEWLEQPAAYQWVRLEAQDGSLDDIQAARADGSLQLLQVKFSTDPSSTWSWDDLLKQESGKKSAKPSLLQKWKKSLDDIQETGVVVFEAALRTNREAAADLKACLTEFGTVDWAMLSSDRQATLSAHLGGDDLAEKFLSSFHFFFRERSYEALASSLRHRFFRLGGTPEGWSHLLERIRRWINRNDEPNSDGRITVNDLQAAALWHLPPRIPQDFLVPLDYVAPAEWSARDVEPRLRAGGDAVVVVTGSPGAGKSTYLSWLLAQFRAADVPVVRHHYFLSLVDPTPHRTAWETAADALIGELRVLYPALIQDAADSINPTPDKLRSFLESAGRARKGKDPLVVVVDGLDHVWRDTGREEGLQRLFDLLLPPPTGVVVLIGTQDLDVSRIPFKIRTSCPPQRWLAVPHLTTAGVQKWLDHHREHLALPEHEEHAERALADLADAFHEVSGGHPLVLHYAFGSARQKNTGIHTDRVREIPVFSPNSAVADYYRTVLWETISPEGHDLLHLLAGFPWAWPRDGLVQCLSSGGDISRLEHAERAIHHVLGSSPAGVTAFHESLLAFVRSRSDHESASNLLRPRVVDWLVDRAPQYWRWRHEWETRAQGGDAKPLISAANHAWCVDSLAAGRSHKDVARIISASGWAALKDGDLATATERQCLDAYLHEATETESVLARLVWLSLHRQSPQERHLDLDLFLANRSDAKDLELRDVSEVAFVWGRSEVCRSLLKECANRWNDAIRHSENNYGGAESREAAITALFAATLDGSGMGPYQEFFADKKNDPSWCPAAPYARALARLCAVGDETGPLRTELRFLANERSPVCFEAVDEIVRLACLNGFDPGPWIQNSQARRSGLLRCCRAWLFGNDDVPEDPPAEVSFSALWADPYPRDEDAFVELARSYFFACLASALEGSSPTQPLGVDLRATLVSKFLLMLRTLAVDAAKTKRASRPVGGAWLLERLSVIEPLEVKPYDSNNHLVRPKPRGRIVVAIAQDLDLLHVAETGNPSLTADAMTATLSGPWTWERIWIEDRVERRLLMDDPEAARVLINRERHRLTSSRDSLHTRAEEYASLAQFCQLHGEPPADVLALARTAAHNLLGHGYHKDQTLFDVLEAIRLTANAHNKANTLKRLRAISPVIQVVDEITDGDGTRYLKRELAEVVTEVLPEVLPSYLRALQRDGHHGVVEAYYTEWAKVGGLTNAYERALAATLVHERALTKLQDRSDAGDTYASTALTATLAYCGRSTASPPERSEATSTSSVGEPDRAIPPIEEHPPARLSDYVQAIRGAAIYGDDHLAAWTNHWRAKDPDGLLTALTVYHKAQGYPLETSTAKTIVQLALERSGKGAAWDWLVTYHQAAYGWSSYAYSLRDVEWIWEVVHRRFPDRWLHFIEATSRPRRGSAGGAPGWSIQRMIKYLHGFGKTGCAEEVLDVAVRWGASLAANMPLPDNALHPEDEAQPVALRLLVDRLDCPSRMVQERGAWSLASLLADAQTRDDTIKALLDWHRREEIETRSARLLLVLQLAYTAFGTPMSLCVATAREAGVVPSIASDILLRALGDEGAEIADSYTYTLRHSGPPKKGFARIQDFMVLVGAHLAPIFQDWSRQLDSSGAPFSRQWEWEASCLARQTGLSLRLNAHFPYHYTGGADEAWLAINDRVSELLRSAYLRALHWAMDQGGLALDLAQIHARRVGVMADAVWWAVRQADRPEWWPTCTGDEDGVTQLAEAVGAALRGRFEHRDPNEAEVIGFASGPVGSWPRFRAELEIRAFLQAAGGPREPIAAELAASPVLSCWPMLPRLTLQGKYLYWGNRATMAGDWLVAPLTGWFRADTQTWLLPERQTRGLHLPATWLVSSSPNLQAEADQVVVLLDERAVARYRHWHDDLRERHYDRGGSRVGGELLLRREWLEPHLAAGATLCWTATLLIAEREKYKSSFGEPRLLASWLFGGSRLVRPELWCPPWLDEQE